MTIRLLSFVLSMNCLASSLGERASQDMNLVDNTPDTLKILCIGNSFNQDVMAYLPPILSDILPNTEITYGVLYSGSAGLKDHIEWNESNEAYTYFNYWGPTSKAWKRFSRNDKDNAKTLKQTLESEDWDIITLQGTSRDVVSPESLNSMAQYAISLTDIVKDNMKTPYALMWNEWMGRPQGNRTAEQMYSLIHQASAYIQDRLEVAAVIPIGTAIQKARGYKELSVIGASEDGNLLFSDNVHMQAGIPALLSAYTTVAMILEYYGIDCEIIESSTWVPTAENVVIINASDGNGGGMTHGEAMGITGENITLVKKIAIETVKELGCNEHARTV